MREKPWSELLIPGVFVLLGALIGSLISWQTTTHLFHLQEEKEKRQTQLQLYSRLGGIKEMMIYEDMAYLQYQANSRYYMIRNTTLSHNADDHDLARKHFDDSFRSLEKLTQLRREMVETIGQIRVLFDADSTINKGLDALDSLGKPHFIDDAPSEPKSYAELNAWLETKTKQIHKSVTESVSARFEPLLPALLRKLRREEINLQ
ncbi:MAG: hypothetical protein HY033_09700 [Ignavibacteriae bacterium]|nr:hypothetical protein [Ignavibacteria bacterium]MBI3365168.1 hypothetical protein [Ignavibacteriota bacterium]